MRTIACYVLSTWVLCFQLAAAPQGQYTRVRYGESMVAFTIVSPKGQKIADVYVPANGEIVFGPHGWPVSGAAWIQARKAKAYGVFFVKRGKNDQTTVVELRVTRLEWDEEGRLISVSGLGNELHAETFVGRQSKGKASFDITSERDKPKIRRGALCLKLKKLGNQEYEFVTAFGKGISVKPDTFWNVVGSATSSR